MRLKNPKANISDLYFRSESETYVLLCVKKIQSGRQQSYDDVILLIKTIKNPKGP